MIDTGQETKYKGYIIALLVLLVCFVLWDNSLKRLPYIYTSRSIILRASIVFPALLVTFLLLYKSTRKKGENGPGKIGKISAAKIYSVTKDLLSIAAGAALLAWMSIDVPIGLAKAFSTSRVNGEYLVVNKACLRDLCQLELRPELDGEQVTVPFLESELSKSEVKIGSRLMTIERHSIFGGIVASLYLKP